MNVEFLYPYLFWAFIIPFVIFAYLVATNKSQIQRIFEPEVLEKIKADDEGLPLAWRNIIFFVALFLMIVAMARPVRDDGAQEVQISGANIVFALDISASMRSTDEYPNRLEFAKQKEKSLLSDLGGNAISLVAFAQKSFLIAPFSDDTFGLEDMIDGISTDYINQSGTDFDVLANYLVTLTKNNTQKAVVLFSDGGDDLGDFEDILKKNDVKLFVVLVGSKKGALVLDDQGSPLRYNGKFVTTQVNESLGKVALALDGAYLNAGYGDGDMAKLANVIKSKLTMTNKKSEKQKVYQELFIYPLGLSLVLLLIALSSLRRRR